MSVNYSAYGIIGVSVDELYTEHNDKEEITKYNPDTGVPYKTVITKSRFFWCGKEVEQIDDMESFAEKYELDWVTSGMDEDTIIGVQLGVVRQHFLSIPGPKLSAAWAEAKEKLEKAGYKGNNIQLHNVG